MTELADTPATTPLADLRAWLELMRELGEVRDVAGASWELEIGALSEANYRQAAAPALLFDEVPGYPAGHRVLTASMSTSRRLGATLGLGTDLDDAGLVAALRGAPARWLATAADYAPRTVDAGPILEHVVRPPDVDLRRLPVPLWHEHDGGRMIGTGCAVFTTDPESGELNAGAYRMQLQDDGRAVSINIEAGKHGAAHVRAWFASEGRAPVTATLGADPLLLIVAGTEVPGGVSELAYAGAMRGAPVEVIAGEVTGLPIPAGAEIAVEGWLTPDQTRPEGPFGEWTGYYSGGQAPVLTMTVERLYLREDPILLGAPPGLPPHDYSYMRSVMKSALIEESLDRVGVPGIKGAWAHEAGGGRLLIAVAVDQQYPGHVRQVGQLTAASPAAAYMNRYVVVVDDDIDPRSLTEVVWAMCTRSDPEQDIEVLRRTWGSRVDPMRPEGAPAYNSRAIIDACRPFERRDSFPRVAKSSEELLASVRERWPEVFGR
jgi:UbiD family decarboxylase